MLWFATTDRSIDSNSKRHIHPQQTMNSTMSSSSPTKYRDRPSPLGQPLLGLAAPSFSNQTSNLSALSAALASVSRSLQHEARALRRQSSSSSSSLQQQQQQNFSTHDDASMDRTITSMSIPKAETFLENQHERLERVEESLLHGTEDILPMDDNNNDNNNNTSQRMTMTELAHACASLQHANMQRMELLDRLLRRARCYGETSSTETPYDRHDWDVSYWNPDTDLPTEPSTATSTAAAPMSTPSWQSVPPLQPLEQVVETDNETDGTVTPGSAYFGSPPLTAAPVPRSATPGTPATPPALASLHLSANTASVLKKKKKQQRNEASDIGQSNATIRHSLDAIESWRESRRSFLSTVSSTGNAYEKPGQEVVAGEPEGETTLDSVSVVVPENVVEQQERSLSSSSSSSMRYGHTNATIIGYDESSVMDDDETEVATVATKLVTRREAFTGTESTQLANTTFPVAQENASELPIGARRQSEGIEQTNEDFPSPQPPDCAGRSRATLIGETRHSSSEGSAFFPKTGDREKGVSFSVPEGQPSRRQDAADASTSWGSPSSVGAHSVKEIIVDSNTSSYSTDADESTLGTLTVNDTFLSPAKLRALDTSEGADQGDVSTPILARYRIEADDSSVGIKVVPNERGTTRETNVPKVKDRVSKYNKCWSIPALKAVTPKPKGPADTTPGLDNDLVSPHVTLRSRKVFRKTPHPKKHMERHRHTRENENPNCAQDLDVDVDTSSLLPQPQASTDDLGRGSLRSPFQRPRSSPSPSHTRRQRTGRQSAPPEVGRLSHSRPVGSEQEVAIDTAKSPAQKAPLMAAFVAKHMPSDAKLVESVASTNESIISLDDILSKSSGVYDGMRVDSVTPDEYSIAPKVVRMQVTLNEVNAGVDALNNWLATKGTTDSTHALLLKDTEMDRLMQQSFSEQKSKSVAMSLCHWRRMSIRHQSGEGARYFQVNPFSPLAM